MVNKGRPNVSLQVTFTPRMVSAHRLTLWC